MLFDQTVIDWDVFRGDIYMTPEGPLSLRRVASGHAGPLPRLTVPVTIGHQ
jgi:hypothetical protein